MIINNFTFKEDVGVFSGDKNYTQNAIDMLYEIKKLNSKSDGSSNVNGWQKEINNNVNFSHIKTMILKEFVEYFQKCVGNYNMDVSVIKFFANINSNGAYHTMHYHEGGQYSGAYWLQGDEDSGNIIIMNPLPNMFINTFSSRMSEKNNYNCIQIIPNSNTGVFFNSNLIHYVDVNRSKKDRIGLGFHLLLKEK